MIEYYKLIKIFNMENLLLPSRMPLYENRSKI